MKVVIERWKQTLNANTLRWIYSVAVLVVLFFSVSNANKSLLGIQQNTDDCLWTNLPDDEILITKVTDGGTADLAGIVDGDTLISINGKNFSDSSGSATDVAQKFLNSTAPGTNAKYLIRRNGEEFTRSVLVGKSYPIVALAQAIMGFGFLIVGWITILAKPKGWLQQLFVEYCLTLTIILVNLRVETDAKTPVWFSIGLFILFSFAVIFGFQKLLLFPANFPTRSKWLDYKILFRLLYIYSAVLCLSWLLALTGVIQYQSAGWSRFHTGLNLIFLFVAFYWLFISGFYFIGVKTARLPKTERRKLLPIQIGSSVALGVGLYNIVINVAFPFAGIVNQKLLLPNLLFLALPLGFGYSIFRYGVMDVSKVLRRSILYGATTFFLITLYASTLLLAGHLVPLLWDMESSTVSTWIAIIVVAIAMEPLKSRLQIIVDRLFFADRTRYSRSLLEISDELTKQITENAILRTLTHRLSTTIHPVQVTAFSLGVKTKTISFIEGAESTDENSMLKSAILDLVEKWNARTDLASIGVLNFDDETMRSDIETSPELENISRSDIAVFVPILNDNKLSGGLLLGKKKSGMDYTDVDIELLSTVAGQAAISLRNAGLLKSEFHREQLAREMDMARDIQVNLLPKKSPNTLAVSIAGLSIPAEIVGGDFFDFIEISETRCLVVVGDVSGKGVASALYMSKIQGLIRLAAQRSSSPKAILADVNRVMFNANDRASYVTLVLALIESDQRKVTFCRAGHTKPIVLIDGLASQVEGRGIGVGLDRGPRFEDLLEEVELSLSIGNSLVLFSDGINESKSESDEEFGTARVLDLISSSDSSDAFSLIMSIKSAVEQFQGKSPNHDDSTLVAVVFQG